MNDDLNESNCTLPSSLRFCIDHIPFKFLIHQIVHHLSNIIPVELKQLLLRICTLQITLQTSEAQKFDRSPNSGSAAARPLSSITILQLMS
jgi:hypothetical protein